VNTQCPTTQTRCPSVPTQCPTVATQCPPVVTQCAAKCSTTCPPVATQCQAVATQCPTVCTQCPSLATQCPTECTKCPEQATRCPAVETQCPSVETRCPAVETRCPAEPTKCPAGCTYTLGYWKTHPASWPADRIQIGGSWYSKQQALSILRTEPRGDATYILAHQLIAAKLNVLKGADGSAVAATIAAADAWLADNKIGSDPRKSRAQAGIDLASTLDGYNNGVIGPGHCDERDCDKP